MAIVAGLVKDVTHALRGLKRHFDGMFRLDMRVVGTPPDESGCEQDRGRKANNQERASHASMVNAKSEAVAAYE
jgi:hypothetical protein